MWEHCSDSLAKKGAGEDSDNGAVGDDRDNDDGEGDSREFSTVCVTYAIFKSCMALCFKSLSHGKRQGEFTS